MASQNKSTKYSEKAELPDVTTKLRGNKAVRLVVIVILILVALYMLYSIW